MWLAQQKPHFSATSDSGRDVFETSRTASFSRMRIISFFSEFIDNAEFPADWFDRTSACIRDCENCGYCESVLSTVVRSLGPC